MLRQRLGLELGRPHELALAGSFGFGVEAAHVGIAAAFHPAQPMMAETDAVHVDAVKAERVEVAMVQATPVNEFDTQFEGGVGFADELVFVQSQQVVVTA